MGLKHQAKKSTVIEVNGVTVRVLRGSPQLEITAPRESSIRIGKEAPHPNAEASQAGTMDSQLLRGRVSSRQVSQQK
jgi:hypothetical protein